MSNIQLVHRTPIEKGWSGDRKYCAVDRAGKKYLLRVSAAEQYERKKLEFEQMRRVAALGIPMCEPLEFGRSEEGVYSIQSWIEGMDAKELIPTLEGSEQYAYGRTAGLLLQKIHSLPAPEGIVRWETRFRRKAERKIRAYEACPQSYENGQAFIDYIGANWELLHDRPNTYQHGDYHIGNMMIGEGRTLYIIDWDRNDFGDPWEEFNRIVWCAQAAPAFAAGMVDGYFDGDVPQEFWRLLALYISSNTLSSLPWAIPFGQEQIDIMRGQAEDVLRWYDNMRDPVPSWYRETSALY